MNFPANRWLIGRLWLAMATAAFSALLSVASSDSAAERQPITWPSLFPTRAPPIAVPPFVSSPRVSQMLAEVQQTDLLALLRQVTGEEPIVLEGGELYVITTRHTGSGTPVRKATQFAFEQFRALGLDTHYSEWSSGGYSNRNVIACQYGGARSNELVLVTAHLDDMPATGRAPGADDNASGSVAVLSAARVFSQYRFDRTIQFVLFTGEEQGELGSAHYASELSAAGANVVAVLNLDMLGWDDLDGPRLRLHTRTKTNPGYTADLAIASIFTNVVSAYSLSNNLIPVFTPDADPGSDSTSFWNQGFPAVYAEEDYPGDFNPNYHTASDTLDRLNLAFFGAYVQAAVGTVAHLAQLAGEVALETLEIANGDWSTNSGMGSSLCYLKYEASATELGEDPRDIAWSSAAPNLKPAWLKIFTDPYGVELQTDSRPLGSETVFRAGLALCDSTGASHSCSTRLRFRFITPPLSNRVHAVRVHVDGRHVQGGTDLDCVTNLQEVIAAGAFIDLPTLTGLTNGDVYGTCEIADRFLNRDPSNCRLRITAIKDGSLDLTVSAQVGAHVVDELEVATQLGASADWRWLISCTNYVDAAELADFDSGWTEIHREIDTSGWPTGGARYLRLNRRWLVP